MILRISSMIGIGWLVGALGVATAAGPFVPPADGPVAFRRDHIPLEVDAMRKLSGDLVVLAGGIPLAEADGRRGVAQALALSLALDPGNAGARRLVKSLGNGGEKPTVNEDAVISAFKRAWHRLGWLESPQAGPQAHALAKCLKDVMAQVKLKAPLSDRLQGHEETGSWDAWVPELEAYREKAVAKVDPGDEVNPFENPQPKPVETPRRKADFKLTLKGAEIFTPMWQLKTSQSQLLYEPYRRRQVWELRPCPLRVRASMPETLAGLPMTMELGNADRRVDLTPLQDRLMEILGQHHGDLPRGLHLWVGSNEFAESMGADRDHSISAVVATLASAVITGKKPQGMVIGTVDKARKFNAGLGFWHKLHSLDGWNGRRLVVPRAAREELNSMVRMGREKFLFEHDVIFADTYAELLERVLGEPSEAELAAMEKFKVIGEYAKEQNLRRYLGNLHVRKRLQEVLEQDPNHASARVLLEEGGDPGQWVDRKLVAEEILRVLDPVGQIGVIRSHQFQGLEYELPDVDAIHAACVEQLQQVEGHARLDDRDLFDLVREIPAVLGDLQREMRRAGEDYRHAREAYERTLQLSKKYVEVAQKLQAVAGG